VRLSVLSADSESLDHGPVALDILALQVVEKTPPLSDDLKQSAPRMMILGMGAKLLGQIGDPL
jgi:hypothetical protein